MNHNHLTRVVKAPGLCDGCDEYHMSRGTVGWLRSEYLDSGNKLLDAYKDSFRGEWNERHDPKNLTKRGTIRKWYIKCLRADLEVLKWTKGRIAAFDRGGWSEMHAYDRNFQWKHQPKD